MLVQRSALVDRPAELLFDVIEAAEHYPHFLPGCTGAVILQRDESLVAADIHLRLHGLAFSVRTRNPKRRPEHMAIHGERGPFRRFEGEWRLTPLAPDACKVVFTLDCEWDGTLLTRLAGPWLASAADRLVDAFVRRAQSLGAP